MNWFWYKNIEKNKSALVNIIGRFYRLLLQKNERKICHKTSRRSTIREYDVIRDDSKIGRSNKNPLLWRPFELLSALNHWRFLIWNLSYKHNLNRLSSHIPKQWHASCASPMGINNNDPSLLLFVYAVFKFLAHTFNYLVSR